MKKDQINKYKDPKILNNQFIIRSLLSSGSFGVVYLAFDKMSKEEFAVKLEKEENEDVGTLEREIEILEKIKQVEGVPKLFWHGFEQNYNVIVITLLGKDLAHYMKIHKKFCLKTILQMALKFLIIMERIHFHGVIHRDLKPENLMVGKGDDTSTMFLVDFGVSKIYIDSNNKHIPFKDNKSFIGTTRYASIAAHKGHELCRRDDLESLFYVLIYFFKGKLPWQNLQNIGNRDRTEVVGEFKQNLDVQELCRDLPSEFVSILNYLKTLDYKAQPNYNLIQMQIQKAAQSNALQLDKVYEWSEKLPRAGNQDIMNASLTLNQHIQSDDKNLSQNNIEARVKDQLLWAVSDVKSGRLKPPESKMGNILTPQRSETRNLSQCSIQGSYSSMQIKYVPSKFENVSQMPKVELQKSTSKEFIQIQTQQIITGHVQVKHSRSSVVQQHMKLESLPLIPDRTLFKKINTLDSTWGLKDYEMDEYLGDSPKLGEKLKTLQTYSGVKIIFLNKCQDKFWAND